MCRVLRFHEYFEENKIFLGMNNYKMNDCDVTLNH